MTGVNAYEIAFRQVYKTVYKKASYTFWNFLWSCCYLLSNNVAKCPSNTTRLISIQQPLGEPAHSLYFNGHDLKTSTRVVEKLVIIKPNRLKDIGL